MSLRPPVKEKAGLPYSSSFPVPCSSNTTVDNNSPSEQSRVTSPPRSRNGGGGVLLPGRRRDEALLSAPHDGPTATVHQKIVFRHHNHNCQKQQKILKCIFSSHFKLAYEESVKKPSSYLNISPSHLH
jgi:hypothetical protein